MENKLSKDAEERLKGLQRQINRRFDTWLREYARAHDLESIQVASAEFEAELVPRMREWIRDTFDANAREWDQVLRDDDQFHDHLKEVARRVAHGARGPYHACLYEFDGLWPKYSSCDEEGNGLGDEIFPEDLDVEGWDVWLEIERQVDERLRYWYGRRWGGGPPLESRGRPEHESDQAGMTPDGEVSASGTTNATPAAPSSQASDAQRERSDARKAFIGPKLAEKGWSNHDWATHSEVDSHTVNDYLRGKTKPYSSTRKKLADSLGVHVEKLPE